MNSLQYTYTLQLNFSTVLGHPYRFITHEASANFLFTACTFVCDSQIMDILDELSMYQV